MNKWLKAKTFVTSLVLNYALISGPAMSVDSVAVSISGVIVDVPDCTVNGNNQVDVDFGDEVITRKVDGQNYKQSLTWTLQCNPMPSNALTVKITGPQADFGTGYIRTDVPGLGIRLFQEGKALNNGEVVNFIWPTQPTLEAAPIAKDPLSLPGIPFTGTATLVLGFQ